MTLFAISFLFLLQLALAVALIWAWSQLKADMARLEQRVAESLDEQDLMDFQERISSLLSEVKETGAAITSEIDNRRASLEREGARAREGEKKLAARIQAMEKAEKRFEQEMQVLAGRLSKLPKSTPKTSKAKTAARKDEPSKPLERPAEPEFKASYRIREFRPPEPQAPVSPTASRYLKVYELADRGLSKEAIAKESGYLLGEIELILNLRPR